MKCPLCSTEKVTKEGPTMCSLMGHFLDYTDDQGREHSHDPNYNSANYKCENGHEFVRYWYEPCPVCGAVQGDETVVEYVKLKGEEGTGAR